MAHLYKIKTKIFSINNSFYISVNGNLTKHLNNQELKPSKSYKTANFFIKKKIKYIYI